MTHLDQRFDTLKLSLFLALSCAVGALAFIVLTPSEGETAFIESSYAIITLLVASTVFAIARTQSATFERDLPRVQILVALIVCLCGSIYLYTREGGGFRISFDEQLIVNVSQNLHRHHLPVTRETILSGYSSYEIIDKRPILFPYLLSLVHGIFGYRSNNVFYLNFFLTNVFLLQLLWLGRKLHSTTAGYFSVALACFLPLIGQNASGGGFEIFNLCCVLAVGILSMRFWKDPSSLNLAALVLSTTAAANVRYETALLVLPISILIVVAWIRTKSIKMSWLTLVAPIAFLPLVWQFRAIAVNPERFQYESTGSGTFSLSYFFENFEAAFRFLFIPNDHHAGSPFVAFIGFAGLLGIAGFSLTRRKEIFGCHPNRVAFLATASFCALHFLLILTFFYGQLNLPITSRLGLPLFVLLLTTGGIALAILYRSKKSGRLASYAIVAVTALYAFKMYSEHKYSNNNLVNTPSKWALQFAESLPLGNFLFVSAMPRVFEIEDYNNTTTTLARENLGKLKRHMELMTYRAIYVFQAGTIEYDEEKLEKTLLPGHSLGPAVELEPIDEVSFLPYNFVRLSRIVGIDLDRDVAPPANANSDKPKYRALSVEEMQAYQKSLP